jgi:hypothetical protein
MHRAVHAHSSARLPAAVEGCVRVTGASEDSGGVVVGVERGAACSLLLLLRR